MAEKKEKIKKVMKHKKLIFTILYLVILPIVLVTAIYTTTYFKNKPVVFDNKNAKIVKPSKTKDFSITLNVTNITNASGSTKGKIVFTATISDIDVDLTNVSLSFELNNNWKNTQVKDSSPLSFNNGGTLRKGSSYNTSQKTINFSDCYPIKPLWFIKLEAPDIYVKVTYTFKASSTVENSEKTVYIRYTFDDYYSNKTTVEGL